MADKATVTLYPPEHAADTDTPIEVHPDMAYRHEALGWRRSEDVKAAAADPEAPGTADPQKPRSARRKPAAKTKEI